MPCFSNGTVCCSPAFSAPPVMQSELSADPPDVERKQVAVSSLRTCLILVAIFFALTASFFIAIFFSLFLAILSAAVFTFFFIAILCAISLCSTLLPSSLLGGLEIATIATIA